jgi:putative heme-binding domain-containing protein
MPIVSRGTALASDRNLWSYSLIGTVLGIALWVSPPCLAADAGGAHAPASRGASKVATDADQLQTLPGFKVEMVLKADPSPKVNGSWINLAKDNKGRLLLGGQKDQPITRVTIGKDGKVESQEPLKLPISEAMGILYAFDGLYINGWARVKDGQVSSEKGAKALFGLFRCTSTNHDDNFDKIEFLREWKGGSGEHGAHAIVVGPDKKLYVIIGNFTGIPDDVSPNSPHRNYADDLVLPRAEDGNGFGAGKKPPGGAVIRLDPDGKNPELFASGQRNTYDIAFNADGELFGFDSDMEWDWGTPWYRPIRVFHAISAGDTGFREGSAKWPEYYADSVPAAVNIGIGCPTGVVFGYGAKFPAKYQKAFYILDWTYGRLIAVHLDPSGASYKGTWENFVAPKSLREEKKTPLNLTDVVIGDDGAMYFTVGGRNTQASLFRVSYEGRQSTTPFDAHDAAGAEARELRHEVEAFHGKQDPKAVDFAWQYLGSDDRFLRYAARIAIESQPVEQWRSRAIAEKNPEAALTALLALARLGGTEAQADVLAALAKIPFAQLDEAKQLEKLRVIEVSIARQGKPAPEAMAQLVAELDPAYPAKSYALNRELSQVLLALEAPNAVAKTMKLLDSSPVQEEQVGYVVALRTIQKGWTPELRKTYFEWFAKLDLKAEHAHPDFVTRWFEEAGRPYADGSSFPKFIASFHADAQKTLSPAEKNELAAVLEAYVPPGAKPKKLTKVRPLVKEWTMADLLPTLDEVGRGRDFKRGKLAYEDAQCLACHRFGNEGGSTGPDLTAVSSRFQLRDILESIIEPSKVISEQYANTTLRLTSGDVIEGRIVQELDDKYVVQPNPLEPAKVEVKKAEVKSKSLSKVSPMPEGLVNTFTKEEILDMMAYVESGGRKDHPDFAK